MGNHGAGFANIVYCKKNTKVIEFTNKYTAKVIKKVCSDINLNYFAIKGKQIGQNSKDQNNDIYLPINKLKNILSQWQFGENRSLPISDVLSDPDLFGGEEDRIPWVEKALKNTETDLTPTDGGGFKWILLFGIVTIFFISVWVYRK